MMCTLALCSSCPKCCAARNNNNKKNNKRNNDDNTNRATTGWKTFCVATTARFGGAAKNASTQRQNVQGRQKSSQGRFVLRNNTGRA